MKHLLVGAVTLKITKVFLQNPGVVRMAKCSSAPGFLVMHGVVLFVMGLTSDSFMTLLFSAQKLLEVA